MTRYEMDDWIEEINNLYYHKRNLAAKAAEIERAGDYTIACDLLDMMIESADDEIEKIKDRIWAAQYHAAIENTARGGLPL